MYTIGAWLVFALWLLARRRTRSWESLSLAMIVVVLSLVAQWMLDPPVRHITQGAIYGVGWFLALWEPMWLQSPVRRDAQRFMDVDRTALSRLAKIESEFRAGRHGDAEYDRLYADCIEQVRRYRPSSDEWAKVRDEEVLLMTEWRDILAGRAETDELKLEHLEVRQKELRVRIGELRQAAGLELHAAEQA